MGKVTRTKACKDSNESKASKGVKPSPTKGAKKPAKTLPPLRASSRIQASKVLESTSGDEEEEEEEEEVEEDQDFSTDGDSKYETEDDSSSVRSGEGRKKKEEVKTVKTTNRTPLQAALSKHLDGIYYNKLNIFIFIPV